MMSRFIPAGMDPIERALWRCTRAELHLYQWLRKRGDGPATIREMPDGRHSWRAIPALERLGLIQVERAV